ncbi:hypothetical protein Mapa_014344 [Marchantia paleacea]|nr:hypothetical protein Mapa_014344 [Marchantia paleacea]
MASLACLAAHSVLSRIGAEKVTFETQSPTGSKRDSHQSRGKGSFSVRNEMGTNVYVDDKPAFLRSGNDQLEITRVINGMWQTSGGWGRIERDSAVDAMMRHVDAGFTTFDMADHYGRAEDLYGLFINKVRRERGDEPATGIRGLTKWVPSPVKMTRGVVEAAIDRSRKRMDVMTLDMLQFHWYGYPSTRKIKTLALTNFDTKRLGIILENGIPIVSNQVQHSLVDMRPQQNMSELCQLTGVKLITYGTVMGGLLSNKWLDVNVNVPFMGPKLDTPSLGKYKRMVDAWGGWSLFQELLRTCDKIGRKHGVPISTVAVRYILDQPCVGGSMIGVRLGLSEQLRDSQAIFKIRLDDDDRQNIGRVTAKGKNLMNVIGDCGDEYRG